LIKEATIYVSAYEETLEFYKKVFREKVTSVSDTQFSLELPLNTLHLVKEQSDAKPYYHFAFLVPYSLFDSAKEYITQYVPLNTQDGADEISFKKGIRSCYFYDPSGNVVEFIAMEAVDEEAEAFSIQHVKVLVEMSLVSASVKDTAKQLAETNIYKKPVEDIKEDELNFIFTDKTILLLSPAGRTWVFSDKQAVVFPQSIQIDDWVVEVNTSKEITVKKA
jgi:catechol-2,3-dioxygenase